MGLSSEAASAVRATRSVEAEIGDLLVRVLASARDHFISGLAEMDLTLQQGLALHHLDAPVAMRALASEMGFDASHITGIVDRLEARGLVERRPDQRDRRIKLLVTTDEGREVRRQIQDQVFERLPLLERLTREQRRVLRDLLQQVVGSHEGDAPA